MSKPSIQISFQGGGAKLLSMLPIAHAFQEIAENGQIKIEAVSGASAGSICASLLAINADFGAVRNFIIDKGEEALKQTIPEEAKFLFRSEKGNFFKVIWKYSYIRSIVFNGSSAFKQDKFREFIGEILHRGNPRVSDFSDLDQNVRLFINASDLSNSGNYVFEKGKIKEAVIASCSIPFVFSSFGDLHVNPYVDGGLCDNLPIEILINNTDSPIFAVIPEGISPKPQSNNILAYVLRLFSASIDNNVERSKALISNAFIIKAPCEFETFDFEEAVQKFKDNNYYEIEKNRARTKILDFCNAYTYETGTTDYRFLDVDNVGFYKQVLGNITQDYNDFFTLESARFEVRINCRAIFPSREKVRDREADTVIKRTKIKVSKNGIRYFISSYGIDQETGEALPTMWKALNVTKNKALHISVQAIDNGNDHFPNKRPCAIIFLNAKDIEEGDEIEISDHTYYKDGMVDINLKQNDFITTTNPHLPSAKQCELVLTYPTNLGKYRILHDEDRSIFKEGDVEGKKIEEIKFTHEEIEARSPELNVCGLRCYDLGHEEKFAGLITRIGN